MKYGRRDEGFSLLEIVIASGLFIAIISMAFIGARAIGIGLYTPFVLANDERFLDELENRLRDDAATSLALRSVASTATSAGSSAGIETLGRRIPDSGIEFAVTDGARRWHTWGYRLHNGLEVVHDGTATVYDKDVSAFTTRFVAAADIPVSLTSASALKDLPRAENYTANLQGQEVANGVVEVDVSRGKAHRTIVLASSVVPSGFRFQVGPQWHTLVHRESETHRSGFGLVQKTTYIIKGALMYSDDNWKTAKLWCDHEIDRAKDTSANNVQRRHVEKNADADKIFKGCQEDTKSREIAASPSPKPVAIRTPFPWYHWVR